MRRSAAWRLPGKETAGRTCQKERAACSSRSFIIDLTRRAARRFRRLGPRGSHPLSDACQGGDWGEVSNMPGATSTTSTQSFGRPAQWAQIFRSRSCERRGRVAPSPPVFASNLLCRGHLPGSGLTASRDAYVSPGTRRAALLRLLWYYNYVPSGTRRFDDSSRRHLGPQHQKHRRMMASNMALPRTHSGA